jgi:ectoine hydroxylase-related dioxygenase (phytanoyl-CoA dioxygenase family)
LIAASMNTTDAMMQGSPVPADLLGQLRETVIAPEIGGILRQRLDDDGYVFVRGMIDAGDIRDARSEVFGRLAEVGEIAQPAVDGIFTGTSRRLDLHADLGAFWRSVSQGPALRKVSHGEQAASVLSRLFDETACPHDYIFLRPAVAGRSTRLHYDYPFFARGSQRVLTVWTALGEIPVTEGPLAIVEGSQHFEDLVGPVRRIDYESNRSPTVQIMSDPVEFVRDRNTRLLTAEFQPGDVIIFAMTTLHGTLDNHSPAGRTRLSCDVRWQPLADPFDSRYMGDNPAGTTGAGYGELNGAKPLTIDWHTR